jgi:predicted acyl esterase
MASRALIDKDVPMTTRDGVTLRADVYRPDAPGRFPVLLSRLPYDKNLRPWAHLFPYIIPTSTGTGEIDFGPASLIDLHEIQLPWFDHWLKGIDTGILDEPPVKIFVMGENRWRDEREWPLARTRYTPYYLLSRGRANTAHGDGVLSPLPSHILLPVIPR